MSNAESTTGRKSDTQPLGWMGALGDWKLWPETLKALSSTYYATKFPVADRQYALAGLTRFKMEWESEHGFRNIPQVYVDAAAAHEVNYHAYRGRLFKRPCAALSTCWLAIICERPERIIDRYARAAARQIRVEEKAAAKLGFPLA